MGEWLTIFSAFLAGTAVDWAVRDVRKHLDKLKAGDGDRKWLRDKAIRRGQATQAAKEAMPVQRAPTFIQGELPARPSSAPRPAEQPWPYAGKHALTDDAEETSAMPVITPKAL